MPLSSQGLVAIECAFFSSDGVGAAAATSSAAAGGAASALLEAEPGVEDGGEAAMAREECQEHFNPEPELEADAAPVAAEPPASARRRIELVSVAEYPTPSRGYPALDMLGSVGQFQGKNCDDHAGLVIAAQRCVLVEAGLLLPKSAIEAAQIETAIEEIGAVVGSFTARRAGHKLVSVILNLAEDGQLERAYWSAALRQEYFGETGGRLGLPVDGQELFIYRPSS